jgi:hypothetical protein
MHETKGLFTLELRGYTNDDIISIDDIKKFLFKVDDASTITIPDIEIKRLRDSAISKIEKIIDTTIINSDWSCKLYGFHNFQEYICNSIGFLIQKPYIKSITLLQYYKNNIINTILNTDYTVEILKNNTAISANEGFTFPEVDIISTTYKTLKLGAVKVSFVSGIFADIIDFEDNGSVILDAILSYVNSKYNGCEDTDVITNLRRDISEYTRVVGSFESF